MKVRERIEVAVFVLALVALLAAYAWLGHVLAQIVRIVTGILRGV